MCVYVYVCAHSCMCACFCKLSNQNRVNITLPSPLNSPPICNSNKKCMRNNNTEMSRLQTILHLSLQNCTQENNNNKTIISVLKV